MKKTKKNGPCSSLLPGVSNFTRSFDFVLRTYSLNVNLSSPNGVRKSLFLRLFSSIPANSL